MILYPFGFIKTPALVVGQAYQGGIIVYLDGTGQHGLIKGTQLSGSATWGCRGTSISTSTAAGTGSTNTDNIVSVCTTSGIAAELCYNSTLNGYSDWYLPSRGDLGLAFANGFTFPSWSSSQVGGNEAVYGDGGFPGYYQNTQKDADREVVPFRSF